MSEGEHSSSDDTTALAANKEQYGLRARQTTNSFQGEDWGRNTVVYRYEALQPGAARLRTGTPDPIGGRTIWYRARWCLHEFILGTHGG